MNRQLIVAGLMLAFLLTSAAGGPPPLPRNENLRVSSHSVSLNNECSFPMEIDAFADAVIHSHYDTTGKLVKTLITMPQGRMTFKNVNNGKSVWTPTVGVAISKTNPDGSLTFGWSGVHARIVVPGQGLVLADLGHVEWTLKFDASGNVLSFKLTRSGVQDGVIPARLCDVLD